jgi:hypothetical protein
MTEDMHVYADALEHLQGLISAMSAISESPFMPQIVLTGGTALHFFYLPQRNLFFPDDLSVFIVGPGEESEVNRDPLDFRPPFPAHVVTANLYGLLTEHLENGRVAIVINKFLPNGPLPTGEVPRLFFRGTTKQESYIDLYVRPEPLLTTPRLVKRRIGDVHITLMVPRFPEFVADLMYMATHTNDLPYFYQFHLLLTHCTEEMRTALPEILDLMTKKTGETSWSLYDIREFTESAEIALGGASGFKRLNPSYLPINQPLVRPDELLREVVMFFDAARRARRAR